MEYETHARQQSKANAAAAVMNDENDAQVAASLAIAYALLDIADAIRDVSAVMASENDE